MKKKIKNLSFAELYEYCKEKNDTDCDGCSFHQPEAGYWQYCKLNSPCGLNPEVLEQEIEIPEEAE